MNGISVKWQLQWVSIKSLGKRINRQNLRAKQREGSQPLTRENLINETQECLLVKNNQNKIKLNFFQFLYPFLFGQLRNLLHPSFINLIISVIYLVSKIWMERRDHLQKLTKKFSNLSQIKMSVVNKNCWGKIKIFRLGAELSVKRICVSLVKNNQNKIEHIYLQL